jgi:ribosomal protein S18 acetylase RimI-like enzyme
LLVQGGEKVVVPVAEIALQLLDGTQAAAHADELQSLRAEVYANLPYGRGDGPARVAGRFLVQCRQPGYGLTAARSGGYLIGWASGMPLRPSTSWWRDLTSPLPDDVVAEHPGRTFALTELMVRASWRRQGIGRSLHDLILGSRREERATVVVPLAATAAQAAFQNWGWHKIARTRDRAPGSAGEDILLTALPATLEP